MIACYVFWNHIEEIEGQFSHQGDAASDVPSKG